MIAWCCHAPIHHLILCWFIIERSPLTLNPWHISEEKTKIAVIKMRFNIIYSLKRNWRQFIEIVIIGCAVSCYLENFIIISISSLYQFHHYINFIIISISSLYQSNRPHVRFHYSMLQAYPQCSDTRDISGDIPAGTRRNYIVIMTSKRRRDVVLTSSWRYYCVMCPLNDVATSHWRYEWRYYCVMYPS